MDLSAIQNIGSCETIWNLVFDNPAGNIRNSTCCLQAQLFSMFSWHAEVTGMHAACVARGYLFDRKVNKTPDARCGRHFYHFATARRAPACQNSTKDKTNAPPLVKMEDKKTWKTRPMIVDAGIVDAEVEGRDWFASRYVLSSPPRISTASYRPVSLFLHRDETDVARWLAKLRKYESTVPCHTASAWWVGGDRQRAYRSNVDPFHLAFHMTSAWWVGGDR